MTKQYIDFTTGGATGDTNDTAIDAVRPLTDGEAATAATFNRPTENLRTRSEVIRDAINELKYLSDADRCLLLTGGGDIVWGGATNASPAGTGLVTFTSDVVVRPFLAPLTSLRAGAWVDDPQTLLVRFKANGGKRAYEGSNEYTITFTVGTPFAVTVTGTPANDIAVTVPAGTTGNALLTLLNAEFNGALVAHGLEAVVPVNSPNDITDGELILTKIYLAGGLDAERHFITQTALEAFATNNPLADGDAVAIYYPGLTNGSGGGRRESMPDYGAGVGADTTDVPEASLFKVASYPEKVPYAIPLFSVLDDTLVFFNGVTVLRGQTQGGLTAGYVQRAGDTMTGALKVVPAAAPASTVSFWVAQPASGITASYKAALIEAKAGVGLEITKTSGTGKSLQILHDGTEAAAYIANTGNNYALSLVQTGATGRALNATAASSAATAYLYNSSTGPALEVRKAATGTAAGVMYVAGPASSKQLVIEPQTAATSAEVSLEVWPSQGTAGWGGGIKTNAGTGYGPERDSGAAISGVGSQTAYAGVFTANGRGALYAIGSIEDLGAGVNPALLTVEATANAALTNDSWLAKFEVTRQATLIGGVLILGTGSGSNMPLLKLDTTTDNDCALEAMGFADIRYSGASSAVRITPSGATASALYIAPLATALPGTPAAGTLGMETFATTKARLRMAYSTTGTRTGERNALPFANWNVGAIGTLYYWVGLDGVLHVRGGLTRLSGTEDIGSLASFTFGTILPAGARPLETVRGTVIAVTSTPTDVLFMVTANTDGDLIFKNTTAVTVNIVHFYGISLDYPLW